MKFSKGNGIKCTQDHCCVWYEEIPDGVDFNITAELSFGTIFLTAYGYGQLKPRDEKSYGNGCLHPYNLTDEQKTFLLAHLNDAPAKELSGADTSTNSVSPKCPHCGKNIIVAVTSGE
jgi:hypothetical protein